MKYPGPIRPEPSSRPSRRWWPIVLTLLCAGGWQLLYWLCASRIVSPDTITLAIVVAVPVAAFVLAGDGAKALFRSFLRQNDGMSPSECPEFPSIDQKNDLPLPVDDNLNRKPRSRHPRDSRVVTKPPRDRW